jgi:hypothetical protein
MTSSPSISIIVLVAIILVVGGITFALIARSAVRFTSARRASGSRNTSTGTTRLHQLRWVPMVANTTLNAVVARSQKAAWAVGSKGSSAVILHWDGRSWNEMQVPALATTSSTLSDIAAVNPKDIWAVGQVDLHPLVLHWNGKTWSQVSVAPITAYSSALTALSVVTSNDIWAVGTVQPQFGTAYSVAEHWDGHSWHLASTTEGRAFTALSANPAGVVWGLTTTADNKKQIVHWNGQSWLQSLLPDPNARGLVLRTLAVGSDGTVWVAGSYMPSGSQWEVPILEHWNGTSWVQVSITKPEAKGAWLSDLAIGTDGTVWAVGSLRNPNTRLFNVFIEAVTSQGTEEHQSAFSLYHTSYMDPHNGYSFNGTRIAAVPKADSVWVIGTLGAVPNAYLPPIDSNRPVPSGGFTLSYC